MRESWSTPNRAWTRSGGNAARLGQELERGQAETASIARELALSQASGRELTVELARVGNAMAEKARELAETRSQVDAERASVTGLRGEVARTEAEKASIAQERVFAQAAADDLTAELVRAQKKSRAGSGSSPTRTRISTRSACAARSWAGHGSTRRRSWRATGRCGRPPIAK